MGSPYPNNPYQFSRNGQLFIIPVGPVIPEVPYPTQPFTKPADYSQWVRGEIKEPIFQLDGVRMPPSMYQEVRDDLKRYSPVAVSRSAFQRSQHAYVGVIDSQGTPYYFALDSRGISVRVADKNDDRVWKTFDRLADLERMQALRERRGEAAKEVEQVDRELREPLLVIKADADIEKARLRYGKKPNWHYDAPGSTWWRHAPREKPAKQPKEAKQKQPKAPKPPKPSAEERAAARTKIHLENYEARARGRQAIRDKLRAERKKNKPAKPKADDTALNAWKQKHPGGAVEGMHAHPFARALDGKLHLVVIKAEKGPRTYPKDHEAAMRVPKGGSCCANCSFVDVEGHACKSENYAKWAGTHKLPKLPLDEICSDWYEPRDPIEKARKKKRVERTGPDAWRFSKALPKKSKEDSAKKTPSHKATKKQAGAGGKTRYTYPQEKKAKKKPKKQAGSSPQRAQNNEPVEHDDAIHSEPVELANQLKVSVDTLRTVAQRKGRKGFTRFMRSHLKRFSAKHGLGSDYWTTIYSKLVAAAPPQS